MLTKRQQEFLAAVIRLAETGEGVHYTQVAEALGVSRWTAYDVLTGLAEKGMLEVVHEVAREGGGGRSRIMFLPTPQAWAQIKPALQPDETRANDLLAVTRTRLWTKVLRAREQGVWGTLQELAGELKGIRHPFVFCASLLVLLLVALRASSQGEQQALLGYLGLLLNGPQVALVTLVGFALALLLERAPQSHGLSALWDQVGAFEEQMKKLDNQETLRLRELAAEVVGELWSSPGALGISS
ncbi:MAG: hypothetical protein ACPLPT_06805 [Moorellales bacterium]